MRKTPVIMSAVLPGLGQFMQGRKRAGTVFLIAILLPFFSMMAFFAGIITSFYKLGFDMNSDPGNITLMFAGMAGSFVAALVVFILSMMDTVRADRTPPPLTSVKTSVPPQ